MKVSIKDSTLIITPEDGIENYALKKWWDGYFSKHTHKESLMFNLMTESPNCQVNEEADRE